VTRYHRADPQDAARVTKTVYADGGEIRITYNPDGTVATRTDQREWTTTYTYDDMGRVASETVSPETVPGTQSITYDYDALGRPIEIVDDNGDDETATVEYEYNWQEASTNQILKEKQTLGSEPTQVVERRMDALGRTTLLTYPGPSGKRLQVDISWDSIPRACSIWSGEDRMVTYGYSGAYLSERMFGSNGALTGHGTHDSFGRLSYYGYLTNTYDDLALIQNTYDFASNLERRADQLNEDWEQRYDYDDLHRLIYAEEGPPEETELRSWTWDDSATSGDNKLDHLGNWVQSEKTVGENSVTDLRQHDRANQIVTRDVARTPVAITYDAASNLATMERYIGENLETWTFTYDFRNRLVKAKNTTDGTEARYLYDGLNRRVKNTVEKVLDSPPDTRYNYSGWQVLEELEFDDIAEEWNLTRQYIYGTQYIDEIVAAVNDPGEQDETIMNYMQDANYNVIGIVDEEGGVKERCNYAPYGDITITDANYLSRTESAAGNTLTFQGRRLDTETGLYYYRNRYYSPDLGRFMQRDPLGYVDGMNLYEFVGGRVTVAVDPMGLTPITFGSPWYDDVLLSPLPEPTHEACSAAEVFAELDKYLRQSLISAIESYEYIDFRNCDDDITGIQLSSDEKQMLQNGMRNACQRFETVLDMLESPPRYAHRVAYVGLFGSNRSKNQKLLRKAFDRSCGKGKIILVCECKCRETEGEPVYSWYTPHYGLGGRIHICDEFLKQGYGSVVRKFIHELTHYGGSKDPDPVTGYISPEWKNAHNFESWIYTETLPDRIDEWFHNTLVP